MLGRMINRLLPKREADPYRDNISLTMRPEFQKLAKGFDDMEKEITPNEAAKNPSGPLKTPGEQTHADQVQDLRAGAHAGQLESFHTAVERRIKESNSAMSPEEWTSLALNAFHGVEHPRPAPESAPVVIPQFAEPDPSARLPSAVDVLAQLPSNVQPLSRAQLQAAADEVLKNDPDDIREFFREVLDRVFGKVQN